MPAENQSNRGGCRRSGLPDVPPIAAPPATAGPAESTAAARAPGRAVASPLTRAACRLRKPAQVWQCEAASAHRPHATPRAADEEDGRAREDCTISEIKN